ncbi:hypothetical protein K3495_g1358 [Podosphaera aphanis]|nr:hypothetical protein K3495_g1358 [Podosphaera aphanis]
MHPGRVEGNHHLKTASSESNYVSSEGEVIMSAAPQNLEEPLTPSIRVYSTSSKSDAGIEIPSRSSTKRAYRLSSESRQLDSEAEVTSHCEKRQCSGNYLTSPLPPTNRIARSRKVNKTSPSTRENNFRPRSSRFLEGSMNDRVSQMPPLDYLGPEDELLKDEKCQKNDTRARRCPNSVGSSQYCHHSSMSGPSVSSNPDSLNSFFKIGKSIVATFNLGSWKIKPRTQEPYKNNLNAQNQLFQERQEKATKVYSEMKKSGQLREIAIRSEFRQSESQKTLVPHHSEKYDSDFSIYEETIGFTRKKQDRDCVSSIVSKRDGEEKRSDRIHKSSTIACNMGQASSPSDPAITIHLHPNYPSRSNVHAKSPLFSSLRKALTCTPNLIDQSDQVARKIPSRKDLQKQKKLAMRVSDLEIKLDAARRQLEEAQAEAQATHEFIPCHFNAQESSGLGPVQSVSSESCMTRCRGLENDKKRNGNGNANQSMCDSGLKILSCTLAAPNFPSNYNLSRKSRASCVIKSHPCETSTSGSVTNTEEDASIRGSSISRITSDMAQDSSGTDEDYQSFPERIDSLPNISPKKRSHKQETDHAKKSPVEPSTKCIQNEFKSGYHKLNPSESSLVSSLSDVPGESSSVSRSSHEEPSKPSNFGSSASPKHRRASANGNRNSLQRMSPVKRCRQSSPTRKRCPGVHNKLNGNEIPLLPHPTQDKKSTGDLGQATNLSRHEEPLSQCWNSGVSCATELEEVPPLPTTYQMEFFNNKKPGMPGESERINGFAADTRDAIEFTLDAIEPVPPRDSRVSEEDESSETKIYEWPADVF